VRAASPAESGHLSCRGFRISYEVFGDPRAPAVLLLPTWQISPSLHWKLQVPYLARWFRVITFDPPGIGGAERTEDPAAFELDRVVDYGVDLLGHLQIGRAHVVGLSMGGAYGLWMAGRYPQLVTRLVLIGTVPPEWAFGEDPAFWQRRGTYDGWDKRNAHYWREHYDDWLAFFMQQVFSEPHSTKPIEEATGWAKQTTPEILIASVINPRLLPAMPLAEVLRRIRCPVLLMHARDDRIADIAMSRTLAEVRPDWELIEFEAGGHAIHIRNAVRVNLEIARFLGVPAPRRRILRRAMARKKPRALFISSPIGLGHVQRDLAIARELRRLVGDLEIEWLAQDPVTRVLQDAGETIHPLSRALASESAHLEGSAGEHELRAFQAFRDLDEIFLANFMVFLEAVRDGAYDLWIGDEAWEVDYWLHENPELKTAPFAFLTDFVGFLPVDRRPGSEESRLASDYNAEMIEQVERFPRVRDRAVYLGDPGDLLPERFGPGLPPIRDWTLEHFSAAGYVTPFDPADYADARAVRRRLGYDPERPLVICTVGGTGIGRRLLRKAVDAWPLIRAQRPEARCVAVAGPRIDPASFPRNPGLEVRGYVPNLYQHLAVADLGIVQGGLATTMELTITRRPFLYFPLAGHFEQLYHVAYRLDAHGAGRRLAYQDTDADTMADAALQTLGTDTSAYRQHRPGAAGRAASLIAELL
jgi:pimeloyl-ACP methyl ester carboxylesterase/UDP-N-acetylglucosamine:LPS N-acetylglucosamine transferase